VLGGAHPNVGAGDVLLREARAALSAHLVVQGNLAGSYGMLGRNEQALNMFRDVYSGFLRLNGEEDADTLRAALGYASSLINLQRFEEAKEYLREKVPVARSALGENNEITIRMRWTYATALYKAAAATLDDLREAVATLEETERVARREYGGAHPHTRAIEFKLEESRAALRARETSPGRGSDTQIFIKTPMTGREVAMTVEPTTTVLQIKRQLQETEGIPVDQIGLGYLGRGLADDKTLEFYNIQAGGTIHRMYRLGGGPPLPEPVEAAAVANRGDQAGAAADRAESIRLQLKILEHASACRDANCPLANCREMKVLLHHDATCVQGDCATCPGFGGLLDTHARQCTKPAGSCPVPKCAQLKYLIAHGATEENVLMVKGDLANTYAELGYMEKALSLRQEVFFGYVRLHGTQHEETLRAAVNYAISLNGLKRFEEAKAWLCKMIPVARRSLGENDDLTLGLRWEYAVALYRDPCATLDDLREAVTTLEELERTARRVFGGAHPHTTKIEAALRKSRAALRAREDAEPVSAQELDAAEPPPRRPSPTPRSRGGGGGRPSSGTG
jgi:tetratricopeptide (TPR) repeat protein